MADRIISMRTHLYDALVEVGAPGSWEHIKKQIGMFRWGQRAGLPRALQGAWWRCAQVCGMQGALSALPGSLDACPLNPHPILTQPPTLPAVPCSFTGLTRVSKWNLRGVGALSGSGHHSWACCQA